MPFSQAIPFLGIFPADVPIHKLQGWSLQHSLFLFFFAAQSLTVTGLKEPNVHQ